MKTFALFIAIFLFFGNNLTAQTKVGYMDSKKILETMQDYRDAKQKLDLLVTEWQKELVLLQDSLKLIKEDFEKKKLILTDQMKTESEKKISDLDNSISNFRLQKFGEAGEYYQKQTEFMKPVYDKIFKAIEIAAKADDYDYVFDRNSELLLLYVNEKYDLTPKIIKTLEGK
jgi:outer membrane protein